MEAVAPEIGMSLAFHTYANVGAGVPDHVPGVAVNTLPSVGVPEIVGRVVFTGARDVGAATSLSVEVRRLMPINII